MKQDYMAAVALLESDSVMLGKELFRGSAELTLEDRSHRQPWGGQEWKKHLGYKGAR